MTRRAAARGSGCAERGRDGAAVSCGFREVSFHDGRVVADLIDVLRGEGAVRVVDENEQDFEQALSVGIGGRAAAHSIQHVIDGQVLARCAVRIRLDERLLFDRRIAVGDVEEARHLFRRRESIRYSSSQE